MVVPLVSRKLLSQMSCIIFSISLPKLLICFCQASSLNRSDAKSVSILHSCKMQNCALQYQYIISYMSLYRVFAGVRAGLILIKATFSVDCKCN